MKGKQNFDVIIVGGSYAGLSAAMALGRSLRRVLVIDSGLPCNWQTPHAHNFITHDGEKPGAILAKAKTELSNYATVEFLNGLAVKGLKTPTGFSVFTNEGQEYFTKKIIFATGIRDQFPDITGFAECWGISIVHCPYCHGYEIRGHKTGIMANGKKAFHIASLVNNLTNNISIITNGPADFDEKELMILKKNNIGIIEKRATRIVHDNGQIKQLVFGNGSVEEFAAVYAAIPFVQHSEIPASLGCEITEAGFIKVDEFQKTTIPGIYACGDNSVMMRSLANAVASGNLAGAMANKELTDDTFN